MYQPISKEIIRLGIDIVSEIPRVAMCWLVITFPYMALQTGSAGCLSDSFFFENVGSLVLPVVCRMLTRLCLRTI